jgi:hypothetical protein
MKGVVACMVACGAIGCGTGTRHTVKPPEHPNPSAPIEVGPIVDEGGVDLGPVLAERMRERKLADAHVVDAPSGAVPYVQGTVRATEADRGQGGSVMSGVFTLSGGIILADVGITLLAIGQSDSGTDLKPLGGVFTGFGVALSALAIYFLTRPSQYMKADVKADLDVRRAGFAKPLHVEDRALVRHNAGDPSPGGSRLLDGVANAVVAEAQTR